MKVVTQMVIVVMRMMMRVLVAVVEAAVVMYGRTGAMASPM
jgi:hypothetical protein